MCKPLDEDPVDIKFGSLWDLEKFFQPGKACFWINLCCLKTSKSRNSWQEECWREGVVVDLGGMLKTLQLDGHGVHFFRYNPILLVL